MNMNDGGPAFPRAMVTSGHDELTQDKGNTGMTLRDYYAGQALAGGRHERNTGHASGVGRGPVSR